MRKAEVEECVKGRCLDMFSLKYPGRDFERGKDLVRGLLIHRWCLKPREQLIMPIERAKWRGPSTGPRCTSPFCKGRIKRGGRGKPVECSFLEAK